MSSYYYRITPNDKKRTVIPATRIEHTGDIVKFFHDGQRALDGLVAVTANDVEIERLGVSDPDDLDYDDRIALLGIPFTKMVLDGVEKPLMATTISISFDDEYILHEVYVEPEKTVHWIIPFKFLKLMVFPKVSEMPASWDDTAEMAVM